MKPEYEIFQEDNGLRWIYKRVAGTKLAHCGFIINTGSRHDGKFPGLAHCFEHMVFKGTQKRKTIHVLNHLEVVGGEMNAFTTKDLTAIYATVQGTHLTRAIDILFDVTFRSVFPLAELKKEKKVIAEEINLYLDTPEENIYDEFQEQIFTGHPLAHNILGTKESVDSIEVEDLIQFRNERYGVDNLVFVVVGNISKQRAKQAIAKYAGNIGPFGPVGKEETVAFQYQAKSIEKQTEYVQGYAMLGLPAWEENHENRWPLLLLNNLLGGPGLNSRLNLAIREKYGFTYHVESGYQSHQDLGLFHCYVSSEKKYLNRSIELIEKELRKLKEQKLGILQMSRARNQFKGQIVMGDENKSNLLIHLGKGVLRRGKAQSLEEVLKKIDAVTPEKLQDIANELFDFQNMSKLIYLPE